jgi:transcriptional regulator with XRE-family HTH domain
MASSPEADRLAAAIRSAMKRQGLSGRDMADRIGQLRGEPVNDMWISRRVTGTKALVAPVRFDPELELWALALEVPYAELTRAALTPSNDEAGADTPAPSSLADSR